jgi:hypothetical protein
MTKAELMKVADFTVIKDTVGKVTFLGYTDVRGLDLDKIINFKEREIVIYADDNDKPPIGEGIYCFFHFISNNIRFKQKSRNNAL